MKIYNTLTRTKEELTNACERIASVIEAVEMLIAFKNFKDEYYEYLKKEYDNKCERDEMIVIDK